MPSLQVRDVPQEIYRRLQEMARKEHRSLSQQAIVALEKALGMEEDPKSRRRKLVYQIQMSRLNFPVKDLKDPVDLIREDRDR